MTEFHCKEQMVSKLTLKLLVRAVLPCQAKIAEAVYTTLYPPCLG